MREDVATHVNDLPYVCAKKVEEPGSPHCGVSDQGDYNGKRERRSASVTSALILQEEFDLGLAVFSQDWFCVLARTSLSRSRNLETVVPVDC